MKKFLLTFLTVIFLFVISCGSKEVAKENSDTAAVDTVKKAEIDKKQQEEAAFAAKLGEEQRWINESNAKLEKMPMVGFAYRKTEIDKSAVDKWLKDNLATIKDIVKNMPEGYLLEIKGHSSSFDPKMKLAKGEKPISFQEASEKRANFVYDILVANGIEKDKITFKGVANSELLNKDNPIAPENRRVTFSIVKK